MPGQTMSQEKAFGHRALLESDCPPSRPARACSDAAAEAVVAAAAVAAVAAVVAAATTALLRG
jgi:hypothetical protein